jgi:hypothetical protein
VQTPNYLAVKTSFFAPTDVANAWPREDTQTDRMIRFSRRKNLRVIELLGESGRTRGAP